MATLNQHARVHATTVVERREPAPGVVLLALDAPDLARAARPGQYVMAIPPSAQSAATALAIYEAEGKLASLLFFLTGKRTQELAELRPGDRLDVLGPLGNGFDCTGNRARRGDRCRWGRHRIGVTLRQRTARLAVPAYVSSTVRAAPNSWSKRNVLPMPVAS